MFDGGGLYLLVKRTGGKLLRFTCTKPNGKSSLLSFGDYPTVSLTKTR
ncbi:Arm DNA-binding domain-containing protein [Jeongeupia chitinilytica]